MKLDGPGGIELVLTEVEMLGRLRTKRVAEKPLAAGVAQVEPHADRAFVKEPRTVTFVELLEQFLHLLEMVGLIAANAVTTILARLPFILDRRKNLDFDNVSHVRLRVDGALANVARIVKHHFLHEAVAEGTAGDFLRGARSTHVP